MMKPSVYKCFLSALLFAILLSCCRYADARVLPWADPMNALDASCVVIVKSTDKNEDFLVTEVLLNDKHSSVTNGDTIILPDFALRTGQQFGDDIIKPITPQTRILLYLHRNSKGSTAWKITQSGLAFFWVNNRHSTGTLRHIAHQAIRIHNRWIAHTTARTTGQRKDKGNSIQAESSLAEIAGKDLGKTPEPWMDWYKKQKQN